MPSSGSTCVSDLGACCCCTPGRCWPGGGKTTLERKPSQPPPTRCGPTPITSARYSLRSQTSHWNLGASPVVTWPRFAEPVSFPGCVWLWMVAAVRIHYCPFPLLLLSNTISPSLGHENQHNPDFCVNFIERQRSGKHRRGLGRSPASCKQRAAQ